MNIVACTIVSNNYVSYAKTLADSFKEKNSDKDFYILIVDKPNHEVDDFLKNYKVLYISELNIENFQNKAFKFNVLELNTNVKASFLKYLIQDKQYDKVIYFDPDIYIYQNIDSIVSYLDNFDLVVTPHINTPYPIDEFVPNEKGILQTGIFNLGFIAVSKSEESLRFLDWWEDRCLTLGFNEIKTGLFVDQKWINLIFCYFDSVYILKNVGYNTAYWNLHERKLKKISENNYLVNEKFDLCFFHFSGIDFSKESVLSKYQNRYDFNVRTDLVEIFENYRNKLIENKISEIKKIPYAYNCYSNGKMIPLLARKLYSMYEKEFYNSNPFDVQGAFYKWLIKNNIKPQKDTSGKYNLDTYNPKDWRLGIIHIIFRCILRIVGVDKYTILMKYFSYISILCNQKEIFIKNTGDEK